MSLEAKTFFCAVFVFAAFPHVLFAQAIAPRANESVSGNAREGSKGDEPFTDRSTGFEAATPGTLEQLETNVGVWKSETGRSLVDDKHSKTGEHCLQLTGGEQTRVILELAEQVDNGGVLSFWAERWTSRKPFSFRIEKWTDTGWRECYNGDARVRVGRSFLNHVQVPLGDPKTGRLRFSVTSPVNTGVLIDDVRFAAARPQQVVSVEMVPFTLPALVGSPASPLLKLKVTTRGNLNPITLTGITATRRGTAEDSPIVSAFVSRRPGDLSSAAGPVIEAGSWTVGQAMMIGASCELVEGENVLWVNGRLRPDVDIDQQVGLTASSVTFDRGVHHFDDAPSSLQRLGVAVRNAGDDGVHTYRIPGLATTQRGTLIGVYDVRRRSGGDLPGDIDVGMSRSTDGGRTWDPMKIIIDMGDDPAWRYDGVGDPAVLVDANTGTIWVAAIWSHGNRGWHGSGPGLAADETGQLLLVRSDDDGITWSEPINITESVKNPDWCFVLQGPGKGITMRDGTLVFAAQYQAPPEQKRLPHSTILYSTDHGNNWQVGTGAFGDTTEAQVVESDPGVLMLNCRYNRKSARVVMTSPDKGKTWREHPSSQQALIEPRACMASLIDVDREVGKDVGGWLLFSNPDSTQGRQRMLIKASQDRGLTWPRTYRLLLDEGNSAGYSCLTMIDENTVGILYEGSQSHLTFQRIPLDDIIGRPSISKGVNHAAPDS